MIRWGFAAIIYFLCKPRASGDDPFLAVGLQIGDV